MLKQLLVKIDEVSLDAMYADPDFRGFILDSVKAIRDASIEPINWVGNIGSASISIQQVELVDGIAFVNKELI